MSRGPVEDGVDESEVKGESDKGTDKAGEEYEAELREGHVVDAKVDEGEAFEEGVEDGVDEGCIDCCE